ncbi:MAG: amidohydrolase family protein [Promethearchaeota archaeon]|nr:MAG: amidohydrolase family protein [Candidatus Lokiarchaeota archaeon]
MEKLIIKNGLVFDPINNINGEIKDILIESGKIVEKFSNQKDVREVIAKGKTVIPSAIDIHTHIASQQVNWVRLLGANKSNFEEIWNRLTLRKIARNYISNGYTFILEANVFPSLAKHTIFNFKQLPVLDKAMLLNVSNLWPLELEFQRGKIDEMAVFLSDLLSKTYGFGFKVYNPFENETWNLRELKEDVSKTGRLYNFSALDVYENLVKSVERLGLPHSVHAHIEGYESDIGYVNLFTVLEKIKSLNLEPYQRLNSNFKRDQIFHIAHANSYSQNGDNKRLIEFLNENQNFDIDTAFIGFNQVNPLITSDRRLINSMLTENITDNPKKLITSAIEFEGDSFVSMRNFSKNNFHDCVLWANALDLALNVKNKMQVSFSLNFPNYANITDVPEIATWLLSTEARENFMSGMNKEFLQKNIIHDNEKVLNFSDFISITRISPAKSLGLGNIKGNLDKGADGDINILDIDVSEINISKDHQKLKKALSNMEYVIKAGNIIKKEEFIDLDPHGLIFWSKGKPKLDGAEFLIAKKKEFYQKYSSMFYESLKITIPEKFLRNIE